MLLVKPLRTGSICDALASTIGRSLGQTPNILLVATFDDSVVSLRLVLAFGVDIDVDVEVDVKVDVEVDVKVDVIVNINPINDLITFSEQSHIQMVLWNKRKTILNRSVRYANMSRRPI